MWRSFDEDVVRGELRVLAEHGVDTTRSFFFWPDFHPEPYRLDEAMVDRYRRFLDLHVEFGMTTIPTFLVGHMSGQNWDPPWRAGRDLYTDVWMVSRQAWFIREMTARLHTHPAVAGWLVSNEMPLYAGGSGPVVESADRLDHRVVTAWAELMLQAVRAGGGTQPVSLGDGAWGREVTGADNGFRVRDIAARVDFVGPHTYHMSDDPIRQHLIPAFICELSHFGRPVVLEEFGVTSAFTSDDHAADYYRQVLHTTLLAGATGWIAWNNTDLDRYDQDPYRHHPYELLFGVTTADGTPKPALRELRAFRETLDRIGVTRLHRPPTGTGLVVSSFLEVDYPFSAQADRVTLRQVLLQGYVSARLADLAPAMVREVDGIPTAPLLMVPSTKALTAPTWERFEQAAAEGSTVYVSYFGGDSAAQRGPWHPYLNRFFGVEHQLRYGLTNSIPDGTVEWTFTEDLGTLRSGTRLTFAVHGNPHGCAFLPVRAAGARVSATDAGGNPALLVRDVGSGRIVFSTYPLEYLAANTPRVNPNDLVPLYRALAAIAGVRPALSVDDPRVFADILTRDDGQRFGFLVDATDERLTVQAVTAEGDSRECTLAPFGIEVLPLPDTEPGTAGVRGWSPGTGR
jgi:endo-1,4-beta-mannosidase